MSQPLNPYMNQLTLSGVVCKTPKYSQSPAGIPHCIFVLEHKSMQVEADLNRNSYVRLQVVLRNLVMRTKDAVTEASPLAKEEKKEAPAA